MRSANQNPSIVSHNYDEFDRGIIMQVSLISMSLQYRSIVDKAGLSDVHITATSYLHIHL